MHHTFSALLTDLHAVEPPFVGNDVDSWLYHRSRRSVEEDRAPGGGARREMKSLLDPLGGSDLATIRDFLDGADVVIRQPGPGVSPAADPRTNAVVGSPASSSPRHDGAVRNWLAAGEREKDC